VAVENVNTHKPEWFPEPVPNETVEIEEELEETDFVVLKVNARDQDVGSDNSRIGSVIKHSVEFSIIVNFINVLRAALTLADPKSTKKTDKLIFFCSFGIWVLKS
jgi:hypothetical protein